MKASLILAGVALALTPLVHEAPACSLCRCARAAGPHEERARADAIFSGRVLALRAHPEPSVDSTAADTTLSPELLGRYVVWALERHQVTIEVHRVWKGDVARRVEVFTPIDSARCGVALEVGKEYLVYVNHATTGRWRTNGCSRTRLLAEAQSDLPALDRSVAPRRASNVSEPPHN